MITPPPDNLHTNPLTTDSPTKTDARAGLPAPLPREVTKIKPAVKNKGGRPPGRKKGQFDIKMYTGRMDLKKAVETILWHITEKKDRQAAQYLIDQMCGTAISRRENVGAGDDRVRVVFMIPPKYSELDPRMQLPPEIAQVVNDVVARMDGKDGKTLTGMLEAAVKGQSAQREAAPRSGSAPPSGESKAPIAKKTGKHISGKAQKTPAAH